MRIGLVNRNKPLHIPTVFVILDSVIPMENPWRLQKEFKRLAATTVGDIYSKPAISISPDTDLSEVARLMANGGCIRCRWWKGGRVGGRGGESGRDTVSGVIQHYPMQYQVNYQTF